MTIGYQELNRAFSLHQPRLHVAVSNVVSILDTLAMVLGVSQAVLGLANVFFSVPL